MTKKLSKKKIIILAILTVALLIGVVITILFVRWNSYYNKIWTPLTTIADNTKCDKDPCWDCINQPKELHGIHKKYFNCFFELPEKFRYKGTVTYSYTPPFDNSVKEAQYNLHVHATIGKDFSDIIWEIDIGVQESLSYGYDAYRAVINPDTLEVIEVMYKEDDGNDHMKDCEGIVREGISNLRSVFSPYLG